MAVRVRVLVMGAVAVSALVAAAHHRKPAPPAWPEGSSVTVDSYMTSFEDSENAGDRWGGDEEEPEMPGTEDEERTANQYAEDEYGVDGSELLDRPLAPPEPSAE